MYRESGDDCDGGCSGHGNVRCRRHNDCGANAEYLLNSSRSRYVMAGRHTARLYGKM